MASAKYLVEVDTSDHDKDLIETGKFIDVVLERFRGTAIGIVSIHRVFDSEDPFKSEWLEKKEDPQRLEDEV